MDNLAYVSMNNIEYALNVVSTVCTGILIVKRHIIADFFLVPKSPERQPHMVVFVNTTI